MITEHVVDDVEAEWPELRDRVAIVFGGVTGTGDRRARRNVIAALRDGCDVVWFDGWEDHRPVDGKAERTQLRSWFLDDDEIPSGTVVIIGYREEERALLVNRLPVADRKIAGLIRRSPAPDALADPIRSMFRRVARPPLRAMSKALRGRGGWTSIRDRVVAVAEVVRDPVCLMYVDDHSLVACWNAARIWTDCPAGGDYRPADEVVR